MKKIFLILAGLFCFASLFAENLYVNVEVKYGYFRELDDMDDYDEMKEAMDSTFEKIFQEIQERGKKVGVDVIDYNSLPLARTYYSWGELRSEKDDLKDRIKKLKDEKKRQQELQDQYSGYGLKIITYDGKSQEDSLLEYDKKIAEAQKQLDEYDQTHIDPDTCRPLLEIEFEYDYDGCYKIDGKIKDKDNVTRSFWNYVNETVADSGTLMKEYVTSFIPLAQKKDLSKELDFVDMRHLELGATYAPVSIAARDDFSFVMKEGNKITDYSPTWDAKSSLNPKLAKVSADSDWELKCVDGKNIVLGNLSYPGIYTFDKDDKKLSVDQYQYPSGANLALRFFDSGRPYVVDLYVNRCVYLPKKSGLPNKINFPLTNTNAVLAGPDETIWFGGDGAVFVYGADGQFKKIVQIGIPNAQLNKVLTDGSFIAKTQDSIYRYDKDGSLLWSKKLNDSYIYASVLAESNGMYYLYDVSSKNMIRYAEKGTKLPAVLASIMKSNSGNSGETLLDKAKTYLEIADAYFENESYQTALENYELYLQICPADVNVTNKKIRCEVAINKKSAMEISEKALNLFDEYGEETAKGEYQKAMQLLEKLKKQVPHDYEVQEMYAELKNAFSTDGTFVEAQSISLEILSVDLNSLFPALMSVYASNPSGYIRVVNNSDSEIKNISVTSYVRKYMDFPSKGEVLPALKPGDDTYLPVSTLLNKSVLNINEATPVQMQFTINWTENGKNCSSVVTRPVTIYKKSALTWTDTAMVACFVQPNDTAVSEFVFNALDHKIDTVISTNITKAIQISDAMGAIPLNYAADPTTPVTQVIDNEYAVDTVRFPAETLKLKGGDCDDMTTLFCSLMESTGINSALITTEGHIFAAFDTGLAYSPFWDNMGDKYLVIEINGHVWIPIETTILCDGFDAAWKTASKVIGKEEFEVTTLASAWESYVSVPSENSKLTLVLNKSTVENMNNKNSGLVKKNISDVVDSLDYVDYNNQNLNALAKICHSLGRDDKAIEILSFATDRDGSFRQGFSNLANLYEAKGDKQKANDYRQRAKNLSAAVKTQTDNTSRASNSNGDDWEE